MPKFADPHENHMVANTPDAPWNQPDAPKETAEERKERERIEARDKKVAEFVDGLNQLADWYEEHPDAPLPAPYLWIRTYSKSDFLEAAKQFSRGGKVTKTAGDPTDQYADYKVTRKFGPIELTTSISRKLVCRLVSPAVYDCPDSLIEEGKEYAEVPNAG